MFRWMTGDGLIVIASRIARSVGLGLAAIILPVYLSVIGYDGFFIGVVLTCALLSSAFSTLLASVLEARIGRRNFLLISSAMTIISGALLNLSSNTVAILLASVLGTMNLAGSGAGPLQAVEQAILPQTCPQEKRTLAYALYSTGGTLAASVGALVATVPTILQAGGLEAGESFRLVFIAYTLSGVASLVLYSKLNQQAERVSSSARGARPRLSQESKRRIGKLSALMGLDSFGGGFVLQSIVSLWFYTRFGASLEQLSLIFFGFGLISAVAYLASARLAYAIGLLNTMVFTHLPSNILTMLIPLAPTLPVATGMYLVRSFLNPMDVAPRQAYIASIVKPEERVAAAAFTNVATGASQAISPSIAGYLLQFLSSLSFPFIIGGGLKAIYDLALYQSFKALKETQPQGPSVVGSKVAESQESLNP